MIVILTIISILSSYVAAGPDITCRECSDDNSPSCSGTLVSCSSCFSILIAKNYVTAAGRSFMVRKSCHVYPQICNSTYGFTTVNYSQKFVSSCCDTDQCNNATITTPAQNTTENGVECPACLEMDAEHCIANETIKCTGFETKCFSFSGKVLEKGGFNKYALQGCVTDNMCDPSINPAHFIQVQGNFTFDCLDRNNASTSEKP